MFKKIASLLLAAMLIVCTAVIGVSAAEADETAAVGAEGSSEVGAEGSSEVGADASSEVGAGNVVSFDLASSGWKNVKKVYCHIWKADGTGDWPSWTTRAEQCTDNGDGTWSYDLSKTGNEIKKTDGKIYCVIFAADTGMQTYNMIMSGACIGDTAYCTGETCENPEDSEKTAIIAAWKNNKDCGAEKKITSKGNIVGSAFPDGENDVTLLAQYLYAYNADPAKLETSLVQGLFDKLKVSVTDVMASVKAKAAGKDDEKTVIANIEAVLKDIKDPTTGEKVDAAKLQKVEANKTGSSTTSNSGSTNSNSSTTKSDSGSSSVSSGQETTIFFVFAGVMIAAAGIMFLARRKREF